MFKELQDAIRGLGIDIVAQSKEILRQLVEEGIEVTGEQDFIRTPSGIFHLLPDGSVIKVILHITQKTLYTLNEPDVADFNRYHLFNCRTLQTMRLAGLGDRYRMAARADGRFRYTLIRDNQIVKEFRGDSGAALIFCKNCAWIYNEKFNSRRNRPFNLRQFIETNDLHSDASLPHRMDFDEIPNIYASDWNQIARRLKEARGYRCEQCGIDLSASHLRPFLHAHHIDGQASNNVLANIRLLCIAHHALQPYHLHVANTSDYSEFVSTPEYRKHAAFV